MYVNDLYLPAKVYLHTDDEAPVLTAQNLSLVLKACLVTGYGSKPGAGWSMPFEDAAAGKRVFRPAIYGNLDNYLRVVDGDAQTVVQSYSAMSDIDHGSKALELDTPYKYAKRYFAGRWAIVATDRSVIVWTDGYYSGDANTRGAMLFYGESGQNHDGSRCIMLAHTGGGYDDGDHASMFLAGYIGGSGSDASNSIKPKSYTNHKGVEDTNILNLLGRNTAAFVAAGEYLAPVYIVHAGMLYSVPGVYTNTQPRNNLEIFERGEEEYMVLHSIGGASRSKDMSRLAISTKRWRY